MITYAKAYDHYDISVTVHFYALSIPYLDVVHSVYVNNSLFLYGIYVSQQYRVQLSRTNVRYMRMIGNIFEMLFLVYDSSLLFRYGNFS